MTTTRRLMAIIAILATLLAGLAVHPAPAKASSVHTLEPDFAYCQIGNTKTKFTWSNTKGTLTFPSSALPQLKVSGASDCQTYFTGRQVTFSTSSALPIILSDGNVPIKGNNILTTGFLQFKLAPGDYSKFNLTVLLASDAVDLEQSQIPTTPGDYFPRTGHNIPVVFNNYWISHGLDLGDPGISEREALALSGYPKTEPFWENVDGNLLQVQYFERARYEWHPENAGTQYEVLLGQLGRTVAQMRVISITPTAVGKDDTCVFDKDTGHNLCGTFRDYWRTNGGLAQFGHPLTEVITEQLENGKTYQVQYFERTRLELHPENPKPYDTLLGQFGSSVLGAAQALRLVQPVH